VGTSRQRWAATLSDPLRQAELILPEPAMGVLHVVYSCRGIIHDGRLWLPYGIGDARIGVAWAVVDELLAAMTPVA
jgi:hypothetical protein